MHESHVNDVAIFAMRHELSPAEAMVLPALFDRVASVSGIHPRKLAASLAIESGELGEYLAETARTVAAEVAA